MDQTWHQRLERSRYEADRAPRQYRAVEPENRMVVRELERQWESALQELQDLEQQYARFRLTNPAILLDEERQLVRSLSENLPAVWKASTTKSSDRQRIVRLLVERVEVTMQRSTEHVDASLQWSGGFISQHELNRPVGSYEQMRDQIASFIELGFTHFVCQVMAPFDTEAIEAWYREVALAFRPA